jgi:hypothetical protein
MDNWQREGGKGEILVVISPHTSVEPLAVMIKSQHTFVADSAMLTGIVSVV